VLVLTQAAVADIIPPARRAFALSLLGAAFAGGALLGPPVGGLLSAGPGWRWAFWLNLPLAALGILCAVRWLPHHRPVGRSAVGRPRLDAAGAVLLATVIAAITVAVVIIGRPVPGRPAVLTGLGVLAAAAVAALIMVERRVAEPILPVTFLRDRRFSVTVVAGMVMAAAMFGTVGYLPTYLQMVRGVPPRRAGLLMLTLVVALGLSTVIAARIVDRSRRPKWLPVIGCGLATAALLLMATLSGQTPLGVVGACYALLGVGIGCAWQILVVIVQDLVPADRVTAGTAANGLFREFGVLLGATLVGALFTARLRTGLEAVGDPAATAGLTPAGLTRLPPGTRADIAAAYADALQPTFLVLAPLLLAAAAALAWLPAVTLTDSSAAPVASGPDGGPGSDLDAGREPSTDRAHPAPSRAVVHG
jgi:predicted MFS family arabinose efflux permease